MAGGVLGFDGARGEDGVDADEEAGVEEGGGGGQEGAEGGERGGRGEGEAEEGGEGGEGVEFDGGGGG